MINIIIGFIIGCLTVTTFGMLYYQSEIREMKELKEQTREEIRQEMEQLERDEYKTQIKPNTNLEEQFFEYAVDRMTKRNIGRGKQAGITELRIIERDDIDGSDWTVYFELIGEDE